MIRRIFTRIKRLVDTPDVEELAAYQHKIPHSVKLAIEYDKNTGFYELIDKIRVKQPPSVSKAAVYS